MTISETVWDSFSDICGDNSGVGGESTFLKLSFYLSIIFLY